MKKELVEYYHASVDPKSPLAVRTVNNLINEGYKPNYDNTRYLIVDLLTKQPISFVKSKEILLDKRDK